MQKFQVGIKAFLLNEKAELMLLRESSTGQWELPGGRIDVGEERLSQEQVLRREIKEELGPDVQIEVGPLVHSWVRERKPGEFVFLVGRLCRLVGGAATLSDEHEAWAWAVPTEIASLDLVPSYREAIAEFWRVLPSLKRAK